MPTLLMRLVGPMQSWGTTSRFDERDTGKEPSKSGVLGLIAAAMGLDRENWKDLEPLTHLRMGVRHDRSGVIRREYQTAGCATNDSIIRADGKLAKGGGVVSERYYLADAAFLVGLFGRDRKILEAAHAALRDPVWPLSLGRKAYVPSEPVWIEDGLRPGELKGELSTYPWIGRLRPFESRFPESLLISMESDASRGTMKMDQPISAFSERRFGTRFVVSEWATGIKEGGNVPS